MIPALLFTVLFVADDPQGPVVVIDVIEDQSGRAVDVVVVPRDRPALSASVRSGPSETPRRSRTLPLLPTGAALTPAVDGAILTIDDIGLWEDPVTASTTNAKARGGALIAPDLRVASPRTLRLFLPAIIDASSTPVPASLHGSHTRLAGTALVLRQPLPVVALSVAKGEADGGSALVATTLPGECALVPSQVVQTLTSLSATSTTCTQHLAVSRAAGKRFGDRPDKDQEASGVVVVRLR